MVRLIDLRSRVTGHWPFAGPVYLTHIGKPSCEGPLEEENLPHYRWVFQAHGRTVYG